MKIYYKIVCFVFFVLTIVPIIFFNYSGSDISTLENKKLKEYTPLINKDGSVNDKYCKNFEEYFEDHLGFKEQAIVFNIALSYKFFGSLKVPDRIEGSNGHVFYLTKQMTSKLYESFISLSEKLDTMKNGILCMSEYFNIKGIKFFFVAIPDKDAIYPEFMPKTILGAYNTRTIDYLIEKIQQTTNVETLYLKDALLDAKEKELLYFRNYDPTHWNMNGAFIGYTKIMEKIKKINNKIEILNKNDFIIISNKIKGAFPNLSNFTILNKIMQFEDFNYTYQFKNQFNPNIIKKLPDNVFLDVQNGNYFYYYNSLCKNQQTILIIGDSYINAFLLPLFSYSFKNTYFIGYQSAFSLNSIVEQIKPDIAIYECVDRMINSCGISSFKELQMFSGDVYNKK